MLEEAWSLLEEAWSLLEEVWSLSESILEEVMSLLDGTEWGDFWGELLPFWAPDFLRGLEILLPCADRMGLVGGALFSAQEGVESSLPATGCTGLGEEVWQWSCDMLPEEEEEEEEEEEGVWSWSRSREEEM